MTNRIKKQKKEIGSDQKSNAFEIDSKILDAVIRESDELARLFLIETVPNLPIETKIAEQIINFLQAYFINIVKTHLELRSLKGENEIPDKNLVAGLVAANDINSKIMSKLVGNDAKTTSIKREDLPDIISFIHLRAIFSIPKFLIQLAILDRREATDKSFKTIKSLMSELETLHPRNQSFVPGPTEKDLLISDINDARNSIIQRGDKLNFTTIAKEMDCDRNTLYYRISKHNLDFDPSSGEFTNTSTGEKIELTKNDKRV